MIAKVSAPKPYAVMVDGEYALPFFFPSEGTEEVVMLTAALQSNPTITYVGLEADDNLCKYSVSVDGEFVGFIHYINRADEPHPAAINAALQSNPTLIPIPVDGPVRIDQEWTYDGSTFTPVVKE